MFYECRVDCPQCSDRYQTCQSLFLDGDVCSAREQALQLRREGGPKHPNDFLLCSDISRSFDYHSESCATLRLGLGRFSDDLKIQIQWCRALELRRYFETSNRILSRLLKANKDQPEIYHLLLANTASLNAKVGYINKTKSIVKKLDRCSGSITNPLVWYDLAYASILLRSWDDAIEYGRRTVTLAPRWMRARVFLIHSLLAKGKIEEATAVCTAGLALNCSDAAFEYEAALLAFANGDVEKAQEMLVSYQGKYCDNARRQKRDIQEFLAYLLYESGKYTEAIRVAKEVGDDFATRFEAAPPTSNKILLSMPILCQGPLMCVPTAVAMVASPQDLILDPDELFTAMHGQDGTAMWRMCAEMKSRGYGVEFIKVEPEAIDGLLRQGIPLIGELEYLFNAHVEVICGVDEGLRTYYIRDPEHWLPYIVDQKQITTRYKPVGNYLIAVVSPQKKDQLQIKTDWISQTGRDLIQLARAQAEGDRESAEITYAALKNNSDAKFLRQIYGRGIAVTPLSSRKALEAVVGDESVPPLSRVKALLEQDSFDRIDTLLKKIETSERKLGRFIHQYIKILKLRHKCLWQKLLNTLKPLLKKHPGMEMLWAFQAEAYAELGQIIDAQKSISMGLEIAPKSSWIKLRSRSLFPESIPTKEQIQETKDLIEAHPDHHHLKQHLAEILLYDDDGIEFERIAYQCIRFQPRLPEGYYRLANWYLNQNRDDLARKCLGEGRNLIGIDEMPYWDFEKRSSNSISRSRAKDETEFLHDSQDGLLNNKQQLFLGARELLNSGQKVNKHPNEIPQIAVLVELLNANQLQWFEAADLIALRVLIVIQSGHFEWLDRALLPHTLPGPGQLSLNVILNRCVTMDLPYEVAKVLLIWAQELLRDTKEAPATLRFNVAVLREVIGEYSRAEAEYQSLQKTHSAFDAVSYRLGQIFYKRGDWDKAVIAFKQTIDSSSGHSGALTSMIALFQQLNRFDEAIHYQRKICQIVPYSFNELNNLLQLVFDHEGANSAFEELDTWSKHHRAGSITTLKARYLLNDKRIDEAQKLLDASREASDLHPRFTTVTQLECALSRDRQNHIEELLQKALIDHPSDPYFLYIKGEQLQKAGQQAELIEFYRNVILNEYIHDHFLNRYLSLSRGGQLDSAIELIGAINPELKDELVLCCAKSLEHVGAVDDHVEFLRWCYEHHPHLKTLHYDLALRLETMKKYEEANDIANSLLMQNPEAPNVLGLKARVIQDLKPKEAITYLEKAYKIAGTVDYLTAIGRSYLLLNEIDRCRDTMFEVLERNPTEPLALTNLIVINVEPERLYSNFCAAINMGLGVGDQYFHVGAVMAARSKRQKLPAVWLDTAKEHFQVVLTKGGYQDEKDRLALAIAKWLHLAGNRNESKQYLRKSTLYSRFVLGWNWPGTDWIPTN